MPRNSGILCPVSALPSRFGIGDFGQNSRHFVDLLDQGGFRLWQILPLNPLGYGHSPYQPFSSFALEELYVDLDELYIQGLIDRAPDFYHDADKVFYEEIRAFKAPYLHQAFLEEMRRSPHCLDAFAESHPWVGLWSLFMMSKRKNDMRSWKEWPLSDQELLFHLESLTPEQKTASNYEVWLQKTLYAQWGELKRYANGKGIRIIGDVPFYVGFDSCDVWTNQAAFLLDSATKEPLWIAGVPPDYFSKTGQRWGNPIYDWDYLAKTNFSFIINRLRLNGELYDVIRLDHFRAFDTYWKIPASCATAVEGSWVEAPGYAFFDVFLKEVPHLEIIAEDLGDLRPEVLALRDHYHFPGMNVVEFTFHDAEILKKPGYDKENMVAYLGTHDNDTMEGYFEKLPLEERNAWLRALDEKGIPEGKPVDRLIAYVLSLPAKYVLISLQDALGCSSDARLNCPGIIDEVNWTWRLKDLHPFESRLEHLRSLLAEYRR